MTSNDRTEIRTLCFSVSNNPNINRQRWENVYGAHIVAYALTFGLVEDTATGLVRTAKGLEVLS